MSKNYVVHPSTVRNILNKAGFNVGSKYANGRIRGMTSFSGDISLSEDIDFDNNVFTQISSRKGNLNKALKTLVTFGFKIKTRVHPLSKIVTTLITK